MVILLARIDILPTFIFWILPLAAGLFLLWRSLSDYFKPKVVAVTALLLLTGTNCTWQLFLAGASTNVILFALLPAVIFLNRRWQRDRSWIPLLFMVPVMTVIAVISAPAVFILLVPALSWFKDNDQNRSLTEQFVETWKDAGQKSRWQLIFLAGLFIAFFSLRQFSWFTDGGSAFYYGDAVKSQFPVIPANLGRVLFSVKNGWLIYSPLILFSFAGFYFMAGKQRQLFSAIFLFLLVSLVWAGSNPAWWFGESFGYPNLVETCAVLALPLGFLVEWAFTRSHKTRIALLCIGLLLVMLNLFQTWQFSQKILLPARMTRACYAATFGRCSLSDKAKGMMETDIPAPPDSLPDVSWLTCTRLASYDFENTQGPAQKAHSGRSGMLLNRQNAFSPGVTMPVGQLTGRDSSWVRATGYFYYNCPAAANKVFLVITCVRKGVPYKYKVTDLSADRFYPRRWNRVSMTYLVPFPVDPADTFQVYFMNYGDQDCYIDDVEILLCKPNRSS
ncbi:MAG: hypothetical protein WCO44_06985 [Bacteroidota bacterium]